jgi:predicted enzyme related to lactoylglutathione lyase
MLSDFVVNATLAAADLTRARRFYEETLGFVPEQPTPGGVMYRSKDSAFGFQVPNLAATVAELKARGIKFDEYDMPDFKTVGGIATTPGGLAAWFKDTEGNIIGLIQPSV